MDKLERVQQKAMKIIRKQGHDVHKRELVCSALRTEGQGEDLNVIFSYLTGGSREDGPRVFLERHSGWTKGSRHQL